ncbi:MAG: APC family permease, partial [Vulcanimicrobiaceae bacterium]
MSTILHAEKGTFSAAGTGRLRRGELNLIDVVSATLANIAPAMSFYFSFGVIAGGAGVASPLTIIIAMIAVLFLANTVGEFSRYIPSAGSFVTFIGSTFGAVAGVATALFVMFGYIVASASVVCIMGGWTADTLVKYAHVAIPWQLLTLVFAVIAGLLMVRGVKISTRWAAIAFYFEFLLLVIVSIVILVANPAYINWRPLDPAALSGGFKGLGLGFPIAIFLFIGWENSAMMAEETNNPRSSVPKALLSSTIAIGLLYTFLAYVTVVGFHDNADAIGKAAVPFITATQAAVGGFVFLAYLAGFTSTFGSLIGAVNSQTRILFNSGRERLLPAALGRVQSQYGTPWVAIVTFLVISTAIVYIFGWAQKPTDFFGIIATAGTIPIAVVYLVTNVALPFFMLRHHRAETQTFRHIVLP